MAQASLNWMRDFAPGLLSGLRERPGLRGVKAQALPRLRGRRASVRRGGSGRGGGLPLQWWGGKSAAFRRLLGATYSPSHLGERLRDVRLRGVYFEG